MRQATISRSSPLGLLKAAGPSAVYSLVDQAAVSIANFVISLWLARNLTPINYSAFTLAYSSFLLAGIVHSALVTEPMLVHANGRFTERIHGYVKHVVRGNWVVSMMLCAPMALAGVVAAHLRSDLAGPMIAVAVAGPLILYHWTARRVCYATLKPSVAAKFDLVYLVTVSLTAAVAGSLGLLSAEVGPLIMGAGSLLTGMLMFRALSPTTNASIPVDNREVRVAHWDFGRWLLGSGGLRWIQGNAVLMLSPVFLGLTAAGELRVLGLLLMPVSQALSAVGPLMSPMLTRARESGFIKKLGLTLVGLTAMTSMYYLLISVLGKDILQLVFGDQYIHLAPLLVIYGLAPIFSGIASATGAALHAVLRTDALFWATLLADIVSVIATVVLVPAYGLVGAVVSDLASTIALAMVLIFALYVVVRRRR